MRFLKEIIWPEFRKILFELGPELCIVNMMDRPSEAFFRIKDHHAAVTCAKVGMIIRAEEGIQNNAAAGYCAEESAHYLKNSEESSIGWMYSPSL